MHNVCSFDPAVRFRLHITIGRPKLDTPCMLCRLHLSQKLPKSLTCELAQYIFYGLAQKVMKGTQPVSQGGLDKAICIRNRIK